MCLILTAINPNPEYKLVLASNRDEFYERPTKNMFWRSNKDILSGEDELKKGMWLGLNKNGRLAAVTNVRDFSDDEALREPEKKESRGDLVKNFLEGEHTTKDYLDGINGSKYQGFNLILVKDFKLSIVSSEGTELNDEKKGTFVLGNKKYNSESEKLLSAEIDFNNLLKSQITHKSLFQFMSEPTNEPLTFSNAFIKGNHGNEFNARFIKSDIYGTRASTIITIDKDNKCHISERVFDNEGFVEENIFKFTIKNERVS